MLPMIEPVHYLTTATAAMVICGILLVVIAVISEVIRKD